MLLAIIQHSSIYIISNPLLMVLLITLDLAFYDLIIMKIVNSVLRNVNFRRSHFTLDN